MKNLFLLAFAVILISVIPANAEYTNGYVSGEGYTYNDGYWYYNDVPYVRSQYQNPGYWYCGRYYPGAYSYLYTRIVFKVPPAAKEKLPDYTEPNFETKLLEIAAARDKYEGEIRKKQFDHQRYLELVNALGLQGNFRWNGYGSTPPYNQIQQQGSSMPYAVDGYSKSAVNANTAYGYSYNTIAQLYGDTNLNQLYQQASQLTANAQRLAGDGNTNFQALVGEEGKNRARVAEILARGQMAHQILTALQGPGTVETKGFSFKFSSNGGVERVDDTVQPDVKADLLKKWQILATNKCASCHSGDKKKGGFDITTYSTMSMQDKQKVWTLLTTPDDTKVMPRPKEGEKIQRLTTDEQRLFFLN